MIGALAAQGLQAAVTIRPFRPAEGALLSAAPRSVLQVVLTDDPDHGFIVIYALADTGDGARRPRRITAAYVASGAGRIQFVPGSHFVLRVVGSTVIFFTWSPDNAPDARDAPDRDALETIGTGCPSRLGVEAGGAASRAPTLRPARPAGAPRRPPRRERGRAGP